MSVCEGVEYCHVVVLFPKVATLKNLKNLSHVFSSSSIICVIISYIQEITVITTVVRKFENKILFDQSIKNINRSVIVFIEQ